jgi:hypothetical protein
MALIFTLCQKQGFVNKQHPNFTIITCLFNFKLENKRDFTQNLGMSVYILCYFLFRTWNIICRQFMGATAGIHTCRVNPVPPVQCDLSFCYVTCRQSV